jgi:hypothetical protein
MKRQQFAKVPNGGRDMSTPPLPPDEEESLIQRLEAEMQTPTGASDDSDTKLYGFMIFAGVVTSLLIGWQDAIKADPDQWFYLLPGAVFHYVKLWLILAGVIGVTHVIYALVRSKT